MSRQGENTGMKIVDFYVDSKSAYLKIEDEVSFCIMIDNQEIDVPSKFDKDNEVYIIKLDDLVKIVQQEGRFPIGVKVNGEFQRLQFKELLRSRVSGRYFATRWAKKKLYITTEGYLNFANQYKNELFISSQRTSNIKAEKARLYVEDSRVFVRLTLTGKVKGNIKAVSIVDFDTQKRYVVQYVLSGRVLKVNLTGVPQLGRYQVIIDSETSERVESQLVKMSKGGTVNVDETSDVNDILPWRFEIENESFILYSIREEISDKLKEVVVKSVTHSFGNCIELEVDLEKVSITGVRTRYKLLEKNIELNYQYSEKKLKIIFSDLDGFIDGDFWIYIHTNKGWYQLYYDQSLALSESNCHFFVHGTEDSARYAYFSTDGYLRYGIKPVDSIVDMSDKVVRLNHLCFLNNYFVIELDDRLIVEQIFIGESEAIKFYQNGQTLFIRAPNQDSITSTKYISILSGNQTYKLEAISFISDASAHSRLALFTSWQERLAIKPLSIEYYLTAEKIFRKIEVEIPNIRTKKLELVISNNMIIEKVLAINRKTLNVVDLKYKQNEQVLVIEPQNFAPFIVDSVDIYVLDIAFVTSDGFALPLVKNHKLLAEHHKKQPWQISDKNQEMLYRSYINASGNLSIIVKDNYYAQNWEKISIKDNHILYETQDGKKIADSGYAIFKYLVDNPRFNNSVHTWVIDDMDSQAPKVLEEKYRDNCKFVVKGTRAYKKALLEAKYLITSHTFQDYFAKKADQILINTWHGTSIKALGFDIVGATSNARNVIRNFMMSDYIISPNAHMTNVFIDSYKLRDAYQGTILEGGYPRNDVILTDNKARATQKLQNFSVRFHYKKPTILYGPTWRGSNVGNLANQLPEIKELIIKLQKEYGDKYNVLLKVHPFIAEVACQDTSLKGLLVPDYIDTNEVLSLTDILIADFSSIFFDYLLTNKPVIFYIPDKEDYAKNRGVYLDFNDLPGPQVKKYEQLKKEIDRITDGKKNKYLINYIAMKKKFLSNDDGKTTERYIRRIFENEKSDQITEVTVFSNKIKLLIYVGGMISNGVTASALNLLNHIDYNKYDVTVMMYLQQDEECLRNIEKINKRVRIMLAFGSPLYTSEEIVKDEKHLRSGFSKVDWEDMVGGYRRNMSYRMFPNMSFDVSIEFSGYGAVAVKNLLSIQAKKKMIYLHSEMAKDARRLIDGKFPLIDNFNTIFTLYPYASKLVSVSETLMEENKRQLAHIVKEEQMTFAKNIIDYKNIIEQAKAEIDLSNLESICGEPVESIDTSTGLNFVTSGRLSSEKNYIALIKAFSDFEKDYPGARLFILGKGPLQIDIDKAIKSMEMSERISMLGHLDNPFAFISKMDYYVLASVHEGQPMVLLEALVLGKKIMASNIKPNIGVLGDNEYGLIANGTTIDALNKGLKNLMIQPDFKRFDYLKYNQEAIEDFNRLTEE